MQLPQNVEILRHLINILAFDIDFSLIPVAMSEKKTTLHRQTAERDLIEVWFRLQILNYDPINKYIQATYSAFCKLRN